MNAMSIESEADNGGNDNKLLSRVGNDDGDDDGLEVQTRKRRALGITLLLIVVAIWTASTYLVQFIYKNDFKAPYFLTFVCNSMFVIYLPLYYMNRKSDDEDNTLYSSVQQRDDMESLDKEEEELEGIRQSFYQQASTHLCLRAALIVSPIWFLANGSYNYSLSWTSPSSNTIISSLSGLFTFMLSVLLVLERFQKLRLLGVIFSIIGAILVGMADFGKDTDSERVSGDVICLISSFLYASYTVAIRMNLPDDEKKAPMMLFFGFLGTFNIVIFGTIGVFLWSTGVEDLSGLTWKTFGMVVLKALFDNVLSDYLWAKAVLLTSPTMATIALTLTIPGPLFIDTMIHGFEVSSVYRIAGGLCVIVGFVFVTIRPAVNAS